VLEAACRQADDVARLRSPPREGELVTPGSKGQPRLAQAVTEVRQGRLAFARLLDGLRLPADVDDAGQNGKSVRAQRAANARWDRVRRVEEARRGTAQTRRAGAGRPGRRPGRGDCRSSRKTGAMRQTSRSPGRSSPVSSGGVTTRRFAVGRPRGTNGAPPTRT